MPVLLFIKGQLIWAAHGRVITFRVLHDLQKTWKNSTKICKFCNIIVRPDDAHGTELSPFESPTRFTKNVKKFHKNM